MASMLDVYAVGERRQETIFVGTRLLERIYAITEKDGNREVKPLFSGMLFRPNEQQLSLRGGEHLADIRPKGNYAYIALEKNSEDGTEIFDARIHKSVGSIGSSEDIIELDFRDGLITGTSDQYDWTCCLITVSREC